MEPNLDDPNNHVPPVSPDDDWGDLDGTRNPSPPALPAVRPPYGTLPGKTSKNLFVNHHAPKPKVHDFRPTASPEPRIAKPKVGEAASNKAESKAPEPEAAATVDPLTGGATGDAEEDSVRVTLPASHGGKRGRVIGGGSVSSETEVQRTTMEHPPSSDGAPPKSKRIREKRRVLLSRRRKGEWGETSALGSYRWMLYTGVGVIALVTLTVILNRPAARRNDRQQSMFSQMQPEMTDEEILGDDRNLLVLQTEMQEEAKRIFATYVTAGSAADFMASVYRAEDNGGLIERIWKPLGAKPDWKPHDLASWTVRPYGEKHYGTLEGSLPDFSRYRAFFRQDEGGVKMDWKATVGYNATDFSTLLTGEGDASEVRLWLSPADFHTFSLPEGKFRSFRLSSPDREKTLWGYVKVGGELDGLLMAEFIPSEITGEARVEADVILSLARGPAESLPNQWMITKLVRLNWLDD